MQKAILVTAIALLAVGAGLAAFGNVGGATVTYGVAILCLIFAFLGQFKRFKGLGVEAELWDIAVRSEAENRDLARSLVGSPEQRQVFAEKATRTARQLAALRQKTKAGSATPPEPLPTPARRSLEATRRAYAAISKKAISTISVVIHVVHRSKEENIAAAQINSQIAVLNQDFRATNPDFDGTGALQAACRRCTDRVPPGRNRSPRQCNQRRNATRSTVELFDNPDKVKTVAGGGSDAWDTTRYLNIWICTLDSGILGIAQGPDGPAELDGVVIDHRAFGTTGTAMAPFDKGRTATREIGRYLGLPNIWGETTGCDSSDLIADTPVQFGPNFGQPLFPHVTCANGPNGDMFMNFMDYVDDAPCACSPRARPCACTRPWRARDGPGGLRTLAQRRPRRLQESPAGTPPHPRAAGPRAAAASAARRPRRRRPIACRPALARRPWPPRPLAE